jgi:hypothetical protein
VRWRKIVQELFSCLPHSFVLHLWLSSERPRKGVRDNPVTALSIGYNVVHKNEIAGLVSHFRVSFRKILAEEKREKLGNGSFAPFLRRGKEGEPTMSLLAHLK